MSIHRVIPGDGLPEGSPQWYRRKARRKLVFEGRCHQLDEVKAEFYSYDDPSAAARRHASAYSRVINRYTVARRRWRAFRGWSS